jgi:hypothetical protein
MSRARTAAEDARLDEEPDDDNGADCDEGNDMPSSHAEGMLESMA